MKILIVDESAARRSIRGFLSETGRSVLEARSAEDAIRIYEKERARIDLVISELDLPGMSGLALLHAIRRGYAAQGSKLTAFLLLTTDLRSRQFHDLRQSIPRFDGILAKPFRSLTLARAIKKAIRRRRTARDALLYIGNLSDELVRVRSSMRLHQNHWSRLFHGATVAELDDCVRVADHSIGGVLVDPDVYARLGEDWLARFRRTRLGAQAATLCLGRMPDRIGALRLHCDLYFEPSGADWEWVRMLNVLSARVARSAELAELAAKARRLRREGRDWQAAWAAYGLRRRDPASSRANSELGEIFSRRGLPRVAATFARRALELNPCSARAHVLQLGLPQGAEERAIAEASARAYCPKHPGILALTEGP